MAITPKADAPENVSSLFKPAVELESIPTINLAIYGGAKTGKTHFAISAAEIGIPVIAIDTENAWRKNLSQFPREVREKIHVAEIIEFGGKKGKTYDVIGSLAKLERAIDEATDIIKDSNEIGVLVVDSATDLWEWFHVWLEENSDSNSRLRWGKVNKKYTALVHMCTYSGWNVIFLHRAKEAVSNKGESLGYNKARWQKNMDYWIDIYGEMQYDGVSRTLTIDGDRFGGDLPDLQNPSYKSLLELLIKREGVKFEFYTP